MGNFRGALRKGPPFHGREVKGRQKIRMQAV